MQTIDIDFEVFKALTIRRETESVTYNDVLRRLLGLEVSEKREQMQSSAELGAGAGGFNLRGLVLPNGTKLRVIYKGTLHTAEIKGNRWVDERGNEHASPSAAATHITGTTVNGWRFWEAKRPSDPTWRKLDAFPKLLLV